VPGSPRKKDFLIAFQILPPPGLLQAPAELHAPTEIHVCSTLFSVVHVHDLKTFVSWTESWGDFWKEKTQLQEEEETRF